MNEYKTSESKYPTPIIKPSHFDDFTTKLASAFAKLFQETFAANEVNEQFKKQKVQEESALQVQIEQAKAELQVIIKREQQEEKERIERIQAMQEMQRNAEMEGEMNKNEE